MINEYITSTLNLHIKVHYQLKYDKWIILNL